MIYNVKNCYLVFIFILVTSIECRIHKLKIINDLRTQIDLTTFGFFKNSYLLVNVTNFSHSGTSDGIRNDTFGFTLDKTASNGVSPYLEGKAERCILRDPGLQKDKSVSVVSFFFDSNKLRLSFQKTGTDFENLNITTLTVPEYNLRRPKLQILDKQTHSLNKRAALQGQDKSSNISHQIKNKTISINGSNKKIKSSNIPVRSNVKITPKTITKSQNIQNIPTESAEKSANNNNLLDLKIAKNSIPLKYDSKTDTYSFYFMILIRRPIEEGLYNLYFHNCYNYHRVTGKPTKLNFTVNLIEFNDGNYLSAGHIPLPLLYFVLCLTYLVLGTCWLYVLRHSEQGVFKLHYLMLSLVYIKSIALLFHAVNYYFIRRIGHHEEAFAILYYITHLMKGALLFITIVLIGAGWTFVKHILSTRDKKIFMIIIPLQILANVAQIIIEETEEGQSRYRLWKEVFVLVDLICCGAILFPIVWSIHHLQKASATDGKAAINLEKLKIFRHFYILIVIYIYFTRIVVYLLQITVPFRYEWIDELFRETTTLILFAITGYKFRPASNNPYLRVSTNSDDETEMDEVVTKSGVYTDVQRVNIHSTDQDTAPKQRESSHEYD